jgi:hypothetical protein
MKQSALESYPLARPIDLDKKHGSSENKDSNPHPFLMKHIPIKDPEYMSEVPEHLQNKNIPGFPSTIVTVGKPGSGKSNLTMNFLTRKELFNGFFDKIYLLGPTVESDKLYSTIYVPEAQKVVDGAKFVEKLKEWTDKQIAQVKENPKKAPKCLFLFEDFTMYRNNIQTNPDFIKSFTAIRHHKATSWVNIHKLAALERTSRMACMHIILFPVNNTDIEAAYEEYGTSDLHKQDFKYLCKFAWQPTDDEKKPFLYINLYAPDTQRFRKCFTHIIDVSHFSGIHKRKQAEEKARLTAQYGSKSRKRKLKTYDNEEGELPFDPTSAPPPPKQPNIEKAQPSPSPLSQGQSSSGSAQQGRPPNLTRSSVTENVLAYLH